MSKKIDSFPKKTLTNYFSSAPLSSMSMTNSINDINYSKKTTERFRSHYSDIPKMNEYLQVKCRRCSSIFIDELDHIPNNLNEFIGYMGKHIMKCSKSNGEIANRKQAMGEANSMFILHVNEIQNDEHKKPLKSLLFVMKCDMCNENCKDVKHIGGNVYEYVEHLNTAHNIIKVNDLMDNKYIKFIKFIEG